MQSNQAPDSGMPSGAVHLLPDDSSAQLPSPKSSMLPQHVVMCTGGVLLLLH